MVPLYQCLRRPFSVSHKNTHESGHKPPNTEKEDYSSLQTPYHWLKCCRWEVLGVQRLLAPTRKTRVRWGGSSSLSPPSACRWLVGNEPVTVNKPPCLCTTAAPISTALILVIADSGQKRWSGPLSPQRHSVLRQSPLGRKSLRAMQTRDWSFFKKMITSDQRTTAWLSFLLIISGIERGFCFGLVELTRTLKVCCIWDIEFGMCTRSHQLQVWGETRLLPQ